MRNKLLDVIEKRKLGIHGGIPSFCCANKIVIEAILEQARRFDDLCLIEATSNQVNQYGGYMGMTPLEFKEYTYHIAQGIGFDISKIILGGDHMGPLPWAELPAEEAMDKAKQLVRDCVLAGYKKIHLDTSMKLGDDDLAKPLSYTTIAERGVELFRVCQSAYEELLAKNPQEIKPVFVIGSEVPFPGGICTDKGETNVTSVGDFENTILAYKQMFKQYGMSDCWRDIIAIVVQPGVDFGDNRIKIYDRDKVADLCNKLKQYPDIVFEGHSTDFQPPQKLREMVQDGIAIIKVGPALSYAIREGLFALASMEKELIDEAETRSNLKEILEEEMLKNPKYWQPYYRGSQRQNAVARKYSFSDRSRYYFIQPRLEKAVQTLFKNIDSVEIPLGLLHQYMPMQYPKVRDGLLPANAKALVKDAVIRIIDAYNYAVKCNYLMEGK